MSESTWVQTVDDTTRVYRLVDGQVDTTTPAGTTTRVFTEAEVAWAGTVLTARARTQALFDLRTALAAAGEQIEAGMDAWAATHLNLVMLTDKPELTADDLRTVVSDCAYAVGRGYELAETVLALTRVAGAVVEQETG